MGERVDDHLHHFAVHFDVAALQRQVDALAQFPAQVAHHARNGGEQAIDALHAGLGNHVAHVRDTGGQPLEHRIQLRIGAAFAQLARQFVARQHHVRHAVHQLVDQAERQADGAGRRLRRAGARGRRGRFGRAFGRRLARHLLGRRFGRGVQRGDQIIVILVRQRRAHGDRFGQLADPVHQAQHCADRRGIRLAFAGANFRQHILGRMAKPFETRQIEEAAAALHRVEEAKDRVQPVAVRWVGLPGDHLARQSLQRLLRFRNKFLK